MANHQGTRGRTVADKTAATAENMRTNTDGRVKFGDRKGKRPNSLDTELNLAVPDGTIPEGMVGLWVLDDGKGAIERKLSEWWGHVTDAQGVNIRRPSGAGHVYLMAIEKEYKDEMDQLREKRYRDSIGENDMASLNVDGVEAYTPNGESNRIKVAKDPFA